MIKFRAWDKKDEVVREVTAIEWSLEYVEFMGGAVERDFDDVILMQSTGLKDKNSVEIFEGDIVLADGVQVTVSFGEQKHEENYGDETYYIGFNVYTKMGYGMLIPVKYEVLGNIYANPELLSNP